MQNGQSTAHFSQNWSHVTLADVISFTMSKTSVKSDTSYSEVEHPFGSNSEMPRLVPILKCSVNVLRNSQISHLAIVGIKFSRNFSCKSTCQNLILCGTVARAEFRRAREIGT